MGQLHSTRLLLKAHIFSGSFVSAEDNKKANEPALLMNG